MVYSFPSNFEQSGGPQEKLDKLFVLFGGMFNSTVTLGGSCSCACY